VPARARDHRRPAPRQRNSGKSCFSLRPRCLLAALETRALGIKKNCAGSAPVPGFFERKKSIFSETPIFRPGHARGPAACSKPWVPGCRPSPSTNPHEPSPAHAAKAARWAIAARPACKRIQNSAADYGKRKKAFAARLLDCAGPPDQMTGVELQTRVWERSQKKIGDPPESHLMFSQACATWARNPRSNPCLVGRGRPAGPHPSSVLTTNQKPRGLRSPCCCAGGVPPTAPENPARLLAPAPLPNQK